mmetsp:Transcript_114849/g.245185  ORF Transcript_114849/g.245185 Transcript_114849/m.245185 type:complete len:225 (+) Transcript_114849:525-1199(+)
MRAQDRGGGLSEIAPLSLWPMLCLELASVPTLHKPGRAQKPHLPQELPRLKGRPLAPSPQPLASDNDALPPAHPSLVPRQPFRADRDSYSGSLPRPDHCSRECRSPYIALRTMLWPGHREQEPQSSPIYPFRHRRSNLSLERVPLCGPCSLRQGSLLGHHKLQLRRRRGMLPPHPAPPPIIVLRGNQRTRAQWLAVYPHNNSSRYRHRQGRRASSHCARSRNQK